MRAKLLALVILASLAVLIPAAAFGQQTQVDVYESGQKVKSVVFVVGLKEYFVNGQTPGIKMDAAPYIDQGRTFVPIRYLAYGLGVAEKNVGWEEKARKVTLKLEDRTAELVVGSKTMKAGGQPKAMDVAPQLKTGRAFLPARWVAEALGYQVEWIPDGELVVCWPKGEPRPEADIEAVKKALYPYETEPPGGEESWRTVASGGYSYYAPAWGSELIYNPSDWSPDRFVSVNGVHYFMPEANGGAGMLVIVQYREALEETNGMEAYDELYWVIRGTTGDAAAAKEITDYVKENKITEYEKIPTKVWTVNGWRIQVRDDGGGSAIKIEPVRG
ncbi:MAG: copper amine oxidase N-terminal domain-containing protein [Moorellales bacterium]